MLDFMKPKVFEIIISLLLSILVAMGAYFVNKLEACEVRIWTLETDTPGNAGQLKALEGKIDLLQKLILQMLSNSGVDTSKLDLQVGKPLDLMAQEREP